MFYLKTSIVVYMFFCYNMPESLRSVLCSLARAFTFSTYCKRCSISSARRVCTAKYVCANVICGLRGAPFCATT